MKASAYDRSRATVSGASMDSALVEYFRCADNVATLSPPEAPPAHEGYFMFGHAVCYGRCRGIQPSRSFMPDLPDASRGVSSDESRVRLPFDLSEVVGNLRRERYCERAPGTRLSAAKLSRRAYYFLRPFLSVAVRKHLQQIRLNGWDRIPFPRWPVDISVDTLVQQALALVLKSRGGQKVPFVWFWPDGANGCAILTHDVETRAGRDFCGSLMDLDDSVGLKSSFQLVPEGRNYFSPGLVEDIRSRGFEVNLHDLNHDGYLFADRQEFLRRAEKINWYLREHRCLGFRSGAMYRNQGWFDELEFSYDMSVPNVAHLEPQRGGCCTVMPYFVGKKVELPLTTIQDYSLFHILGDYSIAIWKKQIDLILEQHGLITLLSHPDYLIEQRARGVYRDLLSYVHQVAIDRNVWMPLPCEVARWWRERQAMTLVPDGVRWRIEGTGSERARVAYAVLENDRLVYQLDTGGR
jgi:hypothetical protein